MALRFEPVSCVFEGRLMVSGSVVCDHDQCMECSEGEWEKKSDWSTVPKQIHVDPGDLFDRRRKSD